MNIFKTNAKITLAIGALMMAGLVAHLIGWGIQIIQSPDRPLQHLDWHRAIGIFVAMLLVVGIPVVIFMVGLEAYRKKNK